MVRLPVVSGRQAVRAFQRAGFEVRRRKGSHIIMGKEGSPVTLSVPDHAELKPGTLRTLIRKSDLSVEEFLELVPHEKFASLFFMGTPRAGAQTWGPLKNEVFQGKRATGRMKRTADIYHITSKPPGTIEWE